MNTSIKEGHANRNNIALLGGVIYGMQLDADKGVPPSKSTIRKMKSLLKKIDKRDEKIWNTTLLTHSKNNNRRPFSKDNLPKVTLKK